MARTFCGLMKKSSRSHPKPASPNVFPIAIRRKPRQRRIPVCRMSETQNVFYICLPSSIAVMLASLERSYCSAPYSPSSHSLDGWRSCNALIRRTWPRMSARIPGLRWASVEPDDSDGRVAPHKCRHRSSDHGLGSLREGFAKFQDEVTA